MVLATARPKKSLTRMPRTPPSALRLSCETPAAPPDRAAGARTRQPENSQRAHLSIPALQTPQKFHEKDPQRGKKRMNFVAGQGKKSAKLWAPHPSGPHVFWVGPSTLRTPHPSDPPPFEPPPFEPPPFSTHPHQLKTHQKNLNNKFQKTQTINSEKPKSLHTTKTLTLAKLGLAKVGLAKVGLAKVGLAKVGRITMAKVGLAKVGFDPNAWPRNRHVRAACPAHGCPIVLLAIRNLATPTPLDLSLVRSAQVCRKIQA